MRDVHVYHDLDAVAAAAGGALGRSAQPSLFDRLDWFRLTLAHCAPPGRPLVLRAGGTWLFLVQDGATIRPLASWYSLRFGAIPLCPDRADEIETIARALRRRASSISLLPMTGALPDWFGDAFRCAGWRVSREIATINWQTYPEDWESWWAARPSRLREIVCRKGRGNPFQLVVLDRFDAQAWRDYETVYAQSWKPAEGSPAFLRALAEQEGVAGTLRLGVAYDGDRPIAAQLWLIEDRRATIHKLAYDAAYKARSPGTLLSHAMFRHAIEVNRARAIDFGLGDDPYKADWMDIAQPLFRLDAWNPRSLAGLAGWARHRAGHLVRRTGTR